MKERVVDIGGILETQVRIEGIVGNRHNKHFLRNKKLATVWLSDMRKGE